nr:xylulose kinase-1 [Tanacetum cinerariifolium]
MLKKGSCLKSKNTKASNVIKFYNDASLDDYGFMFKGKPGLISKGVGAPKHSKAKQKRAKVYYECKEPFKSLKCLWVGSKSIAAIWLEKVVTPLIVPAIKGNSAKFMTTDNDGNLKIRPPVTAEEHQQVQREEKARTILLSALPDEHMGNFYHMIDARDIWNAIKARFKEGLDKGYDKMQKILTQMNTLKTKPDPKDVNMKFLRGLPPFWSGYLSSSSTLSNAAFISIVGSSQGNLSYQESGNGGYTTTHSVSLGSSSSKGSSKSKCGVVDDVIYSFFANHKIDQHLVYEDLDQMNKEDFEEYDLKHQMGMLSIKEAGKDGSDSKAMVVVDGSIDWDKQTEEGNTKPRSLENFGMVAGLEIASDGDSEGEVVSADDAIPAGVFVSAGDVAAAVVSLHSETEFVLMGLSTEDKWNNSGKNLYKLIDSSMSVRTKRGLGLDKYIGEGELGINDFKFSIFHTNSDELEGQPIYNRFASVDHMKVVPPPLTGNYMPLSNIPDIDESQMVYAKRPLTHLKSRLMMTVYLILITLSFLILVIGLQNHLPMTFKRVIPVRSVQDPTTVTMIPMILFLVFLHLQVNLEIA